MAKDLKRRIVAEFSAKNRAKGVMSGFRRDMDTTGRALRRMAVGALAVAGIGGLGYMLKKTMESVDQIAKMSDELQISTEALTGLEHAAQISGTSIESLHKAMGIFVRRMGEAKFGVGEGVRGLKMLNLEADQIIKMGTEKSFMLIAERISQAGSAAEQAGIAYNFFGRQGTQLLNMFQQGREGIEAMREEAERLGLTFSRFDAAQVEEANDALTRARATLTGLFRQATIELSPYIEVLADKFVDVSTAGEGMGANVTNVFELMTKGAVAFGSTIQMVGIRHKQLNAIVLAGTAKYFELLEKIDFIPAFKGMEYLFKRQYGVGFGEFAAALRESATEWKEELADLEKVTKQKATSIEKFFNDLRTKAAGRKEELEAKAKKRAAAAPDVSPESETKAVVSAELKKMRALEATVNAEIMLLGRLSEPRQHARMLIQYEAAAMEEFAGNTKKAAAATDVFVVKLEELEEAQKWAEVAKTMETSFAGALERLSQDWRNYGEVAKQVLHEILMETMRIMAWRPAARALAGVTEAALSGLAGSVGAFILGPGGGMPTVGTVTPEAGATMAKYQYGGIVRETGPAWVHKGENITPPGRGGEERNLIVNVNNDDRILGPVKITSAESYVFSDERIINLSIQAALTNAGYRKSHEIG